MNANSMASSDYMLNNFKGAVVYTFGTSAEGNFGIIEGTSAVTTNDMDKVGVLGGSPAPTPIKPQSTLGGTEALSVTVTDGKVTTNTWSGVLK